MLFCLSWNSLSTSIFFSTNHLRSFCLSFLFLATIFTLINFLATTTSMNKITTNEYTTESILKITKQTLSVPLLSLSEDDFHKYQFKCDGQRLYKRENINEKLNLSTIVKLIQPKKFLEDENLIPYDYNTWQSTSIIPRMVSKCEHKLMMELLKRFDRLAKKYSLEYMMIDGTLLGSWRHHDLIPWDDDIDLLMSVQLKSALNQAIERESSLSSYFIEFYHRWDDPKGFEYYKFYFSISPRFSEYPWRYPFVDLIFYHENKTHIWQENMQHISSISKQSIFPLTLRPFGSLWLPSPYSPPDYFLSVNWNTYENECRNGGWSHKYEKTKDMDYFTESKSIIHCHELYQYYPFVQRSSINQEERLILNGTVKQIIQMHVD